MYRKYLRSWTPLIFTEYIKVLLLKNDDSNKLHLKYSLLSQARIYSNSII